ncbi:MAG: PIN domain-containing protein [Chloroflexi bacterium]|nr:PIN domain-containing protein [Chloroflexota bacterium]MDA1239860.1 PIN domain-containing protein [Chloroflexota bacterium]
MSADFLDTNVLVYLFDADSPAKQQRADVIVGAGIATGSAVISYQVVQETLNVLLRHAAHPASPEEARRILNDTLLPLWRSTPSVATYERALTLRERYGYSFYDSLILAAALEAGCDRLLSEDFQHGQRIDGLTIEDPFR